MEHTISDDGTSIRKPSEDNIRMTRSKSKSPDRNNPTMLESIPSQPLVRNIEEYRLSPAAINRTPKSSTSTIVDAAALDMDVDLIAENVTDMDGGADISDGGPPDAESTHSDNDIAEHLDATENEAPAPVSDGGPPSEKDESEIGSTQTPLLNPAKFDHQDDVISVDDLKMDSNMQDSTIFDSDSALSSVSSELTDLSDGEMSDARIVSSQPTKKRRMPKGDASQTSKRARLKDGRSYATSSTPESDYLKPNKQSKRHGKRPDAPHDADDTEDDGRGAASGNEEKRRAGRPKRDPKVKTDNLSISYATIMGGVRLPHNMIKNPLPTRPPAVAADPTDDILDDMKLILGEEKRTGISDMDAKRKTHRLKFITPKPIEIPGHSIKSFLANLEPPSPTRFAGDMESLRATGDSDNHCSSCLLGGYLVCCDSCPRVFHVGCMNPPFVKAPEGSWECAVCRPRQAQPLPVETETFSLMWKPLLDDMDKTNPKVFELPRHIREIFEGVLTHPHSGAYLDATEREIMEEDGKMRRKEKRQRMLGGDKDKKDGIEPESQACYKCGKTDMKLTSTQFLSSRSATFTRLSNDSGEPMLINDCVRSNMIKCDFCDLCWHYDCLDPPLADVPPRNLEKIDLNLIRDLRKTSWGQDALRDWEWSEFVDAGRPKRRNADLLPDINHGSALNHIKDAESGDERIGRSSPAPNFSLGLVFIRRKWMCPCHVEWVRPKRRKKKTWGWIEVEEGIERPPMLAPATVSVAEGMTLDNVFTITSRNPDMATELNDLKDPLIEGLVSPHILRSEDKRQSRLETPSPERSSRSTRSGIKTVNGGGAASAYPVVITISGLSSSSPSPNKAPPHNIPPNDSAPDSKRRRESHSRESPVVAAPVIIDRTHTSTYAKRDIRRRTPDSKNDGFAEILSDDEDVEMVVNKPEPAPKHSILKDIKESLKVPKELKIKIDIDAEMEIRGVKHLIPVKRVKLDFVEKCRSLRALVVGDVGKPEELRDETDRELVQRVASKLPPVGENYWSAPQLDELYTSTQEDLLVDSAVTYLSQSSTTLSFTHSRYAVRDDIETWLDSISRFENDVAYHLQRRHLASSL
ncbi:hypothetical protein SmJEL517_g06061 [Synchytrium microbalum]|uniref:PHD-type domain-containing protein n=1 Tax=Synchytrium microbalum TaxID=1806994 RepID=A0A507BXC1_9FUNG|nr:uncharacterized protein SmJEL517_g06061 [Synchytrium microbalum]TPX30376.1 hypothetical protein SmJEL517_g06061 [Synchytrium microbalum]